MAIKKLLLLVGAAMAHTMVGRDADFSCGSSEPSQELIDTAKQFAVEEASALVRGDFVTMADIEVDVYMHTVASTEATLASVRPQRTQHSNLFVGLTNDVFIGSQAQGAI